MKAVILNSLVFIFSFHFAFGQSNTNESVIVPERTDQRKLIHFQNKLYTDTTWNSAFRPENIFIYYYDVKAKYPESSESLKIDAANYIKKTGVQFFESGYVTFRFFIDSTGKIQNRIEVFETDENYIGCTFKEETIWVLYDYLMSLKYWKHANLPVGYPPFYNSFLTFKIHEGIVVNIIP